MKVKVNICPKAKRCKFGAECINFDTFRGEYLCFEAKTLTQYARYKRKQGGDKGEGESKR